MLGRLGMKMKRLIFLGTMILMIQFPVVTPAAAEIKIDPNLKLDEISKPFIKLNLHELDLIVNPSKNVTLQSILSLRSGSYNGAPAIGADNRVYISYTVPGILGSVHMMDAISLSGVTHWSVQLKNTPLTSPVIGPDGTIYISSSFLDSEGELWAIKPDGSIKWRFFTEAKITSPPAFGPDGTLYAGSDDGLLYAFNAENRSEKWRLDLGKRMQTFLNIGSDGTIYAGSNSNFLYAIKPDGSMKWTFEAGGAVNTIPAIGQDGTIYAGAEDKKLYAILPNGKTKWEYDAGSKVYSPAVGQDGIYFSTGDLKLNAVNFDKTPKWTFADGGSSASPAIGPNGSIYTQSTKNMAVYALHPNGNVQWKHNLKDANKTHPLATSKDGTVYAYSIDSSEKGKKYLYALKVPVTKIVFNQPELSLRVGKSGNLAASVIPYYASNQSLTWKSSNPKIASVDSSGMVTALLPGTTTITAASIDGPAAQSKVSVADSNAPVVEVSSVALNKSALFLNTGETETLLARVIPNNATNQMLVWKSSNPAVATVGGYGKVNAVSPGSATVTVTTDEGEFIAVCKVTVTAAPVASAENDNIYTDIKGHWASAEIMRAFETKVANGYPDFTFRPNANITRSEFTVMLMNGLKPDNNGAPLAFKDKETIESWAVKAVAQAVQLGIINGYEDGSFQPAANITHAEMISMVVKASGIAAPAAASTDYSDDADIPAWAKNAAAIAGAYNLLGGMNDNKFAPTMPATRAEAVAAIVRMLELK